jgi:hypothetical protein
MKRKPRQTEAKEKQGITKEDFQKNIESFSDAESRWAYKMIFYANAFNNYIAEFEQIQLLADYSSQGLDYSRLKELALNQNERDYSDEETTDDKEMNYIIILDNMIHNADRLLENCFVIYKKLLPHHELKTAELMPEVANDIKLFILPEDERNKDLVTHMLYKWSELIAQLSVYLLILRKKRAVLEALRDNPENPEDESEDEGLTPTQLFLGAY